MHDLRFKFSLIIMGLIVLTVATGFSPARAQTPVDYDFTTCNSDAEQPLLLGGAKPASRILEDVDLMSQPPLSTYAQLMTIANIPKDIWVIVFDLDEQTHSWFRILVPCGSFTISGWIPAASVNASVRRANIYNAPPGCAVPLGVVDSLDEQWKSPIKGTVAVALDVFRDSSGTDYPASFLYPTQRGREKRDKERKIQTSGAFLLSGSVISLDLEKGQTFGFSVIGSSHEPLHMFGIMYEVPEGCIFAER